MIYIQRLKSIKKLQTLPLMIMKFVGVLKLKKFIKRNHLIVAMYKFDGVDLMTKNNLCRNLIIYIRGTVHFQENVEGSGGGLFII